MAVLSPVAALAVDGDLLQRPDQHPHRHVENPGRGRLHTEDRKPR